VAATTASATGPASPVAAPLVVAVGGPTARQVSAMAVPLARARGSEVRVLHVVERDVLVGEDAAELETAAEARALLDACVAELRESGAAVTGELLESFGTHADVARQILRRAAELGAGAIVVGPDSRQLTIAAGVTARIASHAPAHVIVVNPRAGALGRPLAGVAGPADPATIWDGSNPSR
jgi:nucleotide-binding universal stress UspA family protein